MRRVAGRSKVSPDKQLTTLYHYPNKNVIQKTNPHSGRLGDVELNGLHAKAHHWQPAETSVLTWVNSRFVRNLPPQRNMTLHGQDAKMGNVQYSTKLVWALYAMSYGAAVELHVRDIMRASFVSRADAVKEAERQLNKAKTKLWLTDVVFKVEL